MLNKNRSQHFFKKLLIDDVVIRREVDTKPRDDLFGYKRKFTIIETTKGRLTITGTSEKERFNVRQDVADITHKLFLMPDVDIKKNDLVYTKNKFFVVDSVIEPSQMKHHLEAALVETQPDIQDEVVIEENSNISGSLHLSSF